MKRLAEHERDVLIIQEQLKNSSGCVALQRSGTCCSRSFYYKKNKTLIDISTLNQVLEINQQEKYIVLEPLVTMRELVQATQAKGLCAPVITELAQMTVGGALQGLGGESSSFRYGFLDDSVLEYEMLLGDGLRLTVNATQHADLFYAIPGSFGSLGIVTKIKLRLIPIAKYVRITYSRLTSIEDVQAVFTEACADPTLHFIECVALNQHDFCLAKGIMQNRIGFKNWLFKRCKLKRYYHRWFFNHLTEQSLKNGSEQYVTYEDYVFRWNRGNFWTGVVSIEKKIPNPILRTLFRWVFGWVLDSRNLYKIFYQKPLQEREETNFYQDMLVPMEDTKDFFNYLHEEIAVYPVWLIPIKVPQKTKLFSIPNDKTAYYVDFGIWGPFEKDTDFVKVNRAIEHRLMQVNGRKWLWSQGYYEEKEFWHIYDLPRYEALRQRYKAEGRFISIYLKVTELYRSLRPPVP